MPLQQIIKWLGFRSVDTDTQPSEVINEAQAEYRQAQRYEHLAANEYTAYLLQQKHYPSSANLAEIQARYQKHARNSQWCLLQAALRGHADAQYKLGVCYLKGELELDRNYVQAEKWLKKAAQQGHLQAQQTLSQAYAELAFS